MEIHRCRASTATKGGWGDNKASKSAAAEKKVHLHLCTPSDAMYSAGLNILIINATNDIILTTERSNCTNKNRNSFFPQYTPDGTCHVSALVSMPLLWPSCLQVYLVGGWEVGILLSLWHSCSEIHHSLIYHPKWFIKRNCSTKNFLKQDKFS